MSYEDTQRNYYGKEINRVLPVQNTADRDTLNAALGTSDPFEPGIKTSIDATLLSTFGKDSPAIKRDAVCRGLPAPSVGMHSADDRTGCGWWYVPNQNASSIGAYGTRRGPMNPRLDETAGTGKWIWDTNEAVRLEGAKQGARLRNCPDIQYTQFPHMAWCNDGTNGGRGRAVLLNDKGTPAYPRSAGGDCASDQIIRQASQCPPPPPTIQYANECTPNANGSLAPSCLRFLNAMSGCNDNGTMSHALSSGYAGTYGKFNDANSFLSQRGFSIHNGIVNDGKISVDSALGEFRKIRNQANSGANDITTSAAKNLCVGSAFDPCSSLKPTDKGPYPQTCIEQMLQRYGYDSTGNLQPSKGVGMTYWNQFPTFQDAMNAANWWKNVADTPGYDGANAKLQAGGIFNVYGITVKYPKLGCNIHGVLLYRYFFPTWDASLFPVSGPRTHFLGRYILKNGFPYKGITYEDQTPAGGFLTEGQRMVCNFVPTEGGTYQFQLNHDDGIRVLINDQLFFDQMTACCSTWNTPTTKMIAGQVYKLTVDLWNGGGPWSFTFLYSVNGGPFKQFPISQLYMTQDRRLPTIELAFNKNNATTQAIRPNVNSLVPDTNNIFKSMYVRSARGITQMNGKQCLNIDATTVSGVFNNLQLCQGVRLCAMKTITMMVQVNTVNVTSSPPTLISFFNLPSTNTKGYPRSGSAINTPVKYLNRSQDFSIVVSTNTIYPMLKGQHGGIETMDKWQKMLSSTNKVNLPLNTWFHFALVWDEDFQGFTIYLNGNVVKQARIQGPEVNTMFENIVIGQRIMDDSRDAGSPSWGGGIAWVRAFDYRLNADLLKQDMSDDWASLS